MSGNEKEGTRKSTFGSEVLEWTKVILISLIAAVAITTFIKPTLVKGESMYPTINEHDYLIINCTPYLSKNPSFGDIVVFETDYHTDSGKEKDLIKRVIGLPGDAISIKDGVVYRNHEALDEPYINGDFTPGDMNEFVVEENHLFVLGDNRSNSLDSRSKEIGVVPYEDIVGVVIVRLFPFNKIGPLE